MALEEKTVSDSHGNTTNDPNRAEAAGDKIIVGTIQPSADSPYKFFVRNENEDSKTTTITMVLPIGGNLSGLYRFPRVGEKVLVDGNYLLGYVPGEDGTPFAPVEGTPKTTKQDEKDKLLADQQGMVLRYQQTGKKKPGAGEAYSEIGFYHQAASWKPKTKTDYKDIPADKEYPKIDRINIESTGDIHAKAQNHYQTQVKRFELLVDCDEVDHTANKRPFGDRPGDDSFLYAGDAHIRAKNRIVIKAGDEIRLEVGRSSIIINDTGIILSTRKIDSNIMNSWDTIINMDHRSGLTMFGQHVKIDSGMDFAITEGFGGSISSSLGVMRINAKDILAKSYGTFSYIMRGVGMGAELLGNAASMGSALGKADNETAFINNIGQFVRAGTGGAGSFLGDKMADKFADKLDTAGTLANLSGVLCLIMKMVWTAIEQTIPIEKMKNGGRDGLSLAAAVTEYGLTITIFGFIAGKNIASAIHSSVLHLSAGADLYLSGKIISEFSLDAQIINGPLAGLQEGGFYETLKGGLKDFWNNTLPSWKVMLGGGATGVAVGGGIVATKMFVTNSQDEKLKEELMSL